MIGMNRNNLVFTNNYIQRFLNHPRLCNCVYVRDTYTGDVYEGMMMNGLYYVVMKDTVTERFFYQEILPMDYYLFDEHQIYRQGNMGMGIGGYY